MPYSEAASTASGVSELPAQTEQRFRNQQAWQDFCALQDISHLQPTRPEYVSPFSTRDMAGETPLRPGEYTTMSADLELMVLALQPEELEGKRVLYVGTGQSQVPATLRALGVECLSQDIDPRNLRPNPDGPQLDIRADAAHQPFASASMDLILMKHVLNPSAQPRQLLEEALRIVKPGGKIVIFPVIALIDVQTVTLPQLSFKQWGLDWFTLTITVDDQLDQAALLHLLTPENPRGAKIVVKPTPHWTTAGRLLGHYFNTYKQSDQPPLDLPF